MRYGFVIDQDRCIGCHACTVACKEEHQVPVGVFRTWVKYVEKGEFPNTSRHFGVMRCNHCDSAPCIEICPTHALFRRSDGIVDFDNRRCIGCKGCMQACPYDALYIDPNNNTAAKCNFCAHRVENNLEPACVVVCPTQAIIAGDLDNPAGKASRMVATEKVSVRKPHKGTQPKLYYVGIEGDLLEPTRLSRQNGYMFAEQYDDRPTNATFDASLTREVYDVAHPAPWGWKISTYLWTKSISAGVLLAVGLVSSAFQRVGDPGDGAGSFGYLDIVSPAIALIALAITMGLLVLDLKRPDRFFYLLIRPNFRSWLVLGSFVLMAYGMAATAWLLSGMFLEQVNSALKWTTWVLGLGAAGYSAFLFAQAKGRDLWQSPMFLFHLLVQALVAGTATIVLISISHYEVIRMASEWLAVCLVLNLAMVLAEVLLPHGSEDARLAVRTLVRGKWSFSFWLLVVGAGIVLPIILIYFMPEYNNFGSVHGYFDQRVYALAAVLTLAGVWFWEDLWVKAGQEAPLS